MAFGKMKVEFVRRQFQPPLFPGRGKMLACDEPVASVVQEALEGYASGHFETQADVMRFLQ
ncbi:MAG TPA: hypothetical protein VKA94_14660, partial [Hyphomicrobiales bacterium]|nr:hypothetical protein [Hyphomicrobiales bacterium]